MTLQHLDMLFKLIAFLFAISVHESAHAWMANRLGDPTARMLGRVSLNPIKHIDLFGTILLPALALLNPRIPMLGWAKPTPVNPRNFKNLVMDDILTSVAGPVSNFIVASVALIVLALLEVTSALGKEIVFAIQSGMTEITTNSALLPICLLLFELMTINVFLGVFNLIPVPPLDGSHVIRHFLPAGALKVYDTIGIFGLLALIYLAPGALSGLIYPVLGIFNSILARI
jgi:Zn-dependent protease